jgi:hypothetical protein
VNESNRPRPRTPKRRGPRGPNRRARPAPRVSHSVRPPLARPVASAQPSGKAAADHAVFDAYRAFLARQGLSEIWTAREEKPTAQVPTQRSAPEPYVA